MDFCIGFWDYVPNIANIAGWQWFLKINTIKPNQQVQVQVSK